MSAEHDKTTKFETALHASLPMLLMLFMQMALNYYFAPHNAIFLSPYLLSFVTLNVISIVVLLKGQICPGQKGRLLFVLAFTGLFAVGNFLYTVGFTPKHSPLVVASVATLLFTLIYWKLPEQENLYRTMLYCGLAIGAISAIQYLAVYWLEIPSLFNGIRANNFAQLLCGVLLSGWYLMLAKSRLEGFLKLLVKVALLLLVVNYVWVIFVLYQQLSIMPEMVIYPYFLYFASQFGLFALLAWLLLGKNIKNPIAWTLATALSMLYPWVNIL